MLSVGQRQLEPEIMDEPDLDSASHEHALRGLGRINFLSLSAGIVWKPIRTLARQHPDRPLRVLDLATGGGDVPIALAEKARREGLPIAVQGCDISDRAVVFATEQAARKNSAATFFVQDIVKDGVPDGYDVVISSLFLHHLDEGEARDVLSQMSEAAKRLVVVNDLDRCTTGLALAYLACYTLTRSPVVHYDGPRSVMAAFSKTEANQLARDAGLRGARITGHWPFRWRLVWERNQ